MGPEIKEWIDNATYAQLLARWRAAPVGSPYFQGETGAYYRQAMEKRKAECKDSVKVSKDIGR